MKSGCEAEGSHRPLLRKRRRKAQAYLCRTGDDCQTARMLGRSMERSWRARQLAIESQKAPQLSRQEARDIATFDLGKVLRRMRDALDGSQSFALDGIESEILQEGRNEAQQAGVLHRGVMLPRMIVRRTGYEARDMTATGTTSVTGDQGGMTIATEKRRLLDDFYALVIRQAGALVMEGCKATLICRATSSRRRPLARRRTDQPTNSVRPRP